jgi:quercetin dioxygenase-like cupin family protein
MKQLKLMNVRKALALAALATVATVAAGTALATPGSGFKDRTVVARGTLAPHFKIRLALAMVVALRDRSPSDVVVQKFVLAPGGQSGWHLHPGPAIVVVKSGDLTLDQDDCSSATYSAGQAAVEEPGHVHRVRNVSTTTDLEFWVTFLNIPVGSPQRLEPESDPNWVAPAC